MAGLCGISRGFPRLSPTTGQVPTRYSPVRHSLKTEISRAFDLHVLSMPPAFVLSQDQTLMFNPNRPVILPDDKPIVTGPSPAQSPNPIKGHQTLMQDTYPAKAKPYPAARPAALTPPPAHPFIHQQCQSATPQPPSPLSETHRRGRTLIWPLPHHRQPLYSNPAHAPRRQPHNPSNRQARNPGQRSAPVQ
jgi:hypothetical protein